MDIFRHEINEVLLALVRRVGLGNSFKILWIVFATAIATFDTVLNTPVTYAIPVLAVLFGFVHLLAAAHNYELYYNVKDKTRQEIEDSDIRTAKTLSQLDWLGKLLFVIRKNAFTFFVAAFSLVVFTWPMSTLLILTVTRSQSLWYAFNYTILISALGLLFFFPALMLGALLLANRLANSYKKGELVSTLSAQANGQIEIPIETLREAIRTAEASNESTVRIQLRDQ